MALVAVLVEGHHGCQGQGGALKADDEEQEVAGRDHEVHAEQGHEQQLVELASAHAALFAVNPLLALEQYQEDAEVEDALDGDADLSVDIHAAESLGDVDGDEPHGHRSQAEQHQRDGRQGFLRLLAEEDVDKEDYYEHREHQKLRVHGSKL